MHRKKPTGYPIWFVCLVWLLIMCLCTSCIPSKSQVNTQESPMATGLPTESLSMEEGIALAVEKPDTEGPVISGVQPLTTSVGETLSYRSGITAVDDRDGAVLLLVDSSSINLSVPGEYQVIYSAEDSSGNRTEVTTTVVVTEPKAVASEAVEPDPGVTAGQAGAQTGGASLENVNALADQILAQIIKDGMSQREKARAIFDYIVSHMRYVGSSDKSSWIVGAYTSFTTGRGDCFNYYACSKALLTRAGIPTVDLQRVNGNSKHYWVLADVGDGYHHFDPCPHPQGYPLTCFLLTEAEVRQYSSNLSAHSSYYANYYTYDYSACPVKAAGMPVNEPASPSPEQTIEPNSTEMPEMIEPAQPEGPLDPAGGMPEPTPEVTPEPTSEPTPDFPAEPVPEAAPEPTPAPEPAVQMEGQEG